MVRIERVTRPVIGNEVSKWIGRIAREQFPGIVNPNRWLSSRLVTPTELKAIGDLAREDIDALKTWLDEYRLHYPTVQDIPLGQVYPRRPGVLVMNLGHHKELAEERERMLDRLGEVTWAEIPRSPGVQSGLILAQTAVPAQANMHHIARTFTQTEHELPSMIALGGLQVAIRTAEGELVEL